ncbi:MAG: UPF0262 family protein [Alphaproteobacteria bacterium]
MTEDNKNRIASIRLKKQDAPSVGVMLHRDCETALRDLKQDSVFQPDGDGNGPYTLQLSIEDNRLVFYIRNAKEEELPYLVLSLTPYRRLIKDYFIIVQSYDEAVRNASPSRIEAIDMGRRGLHNEGADLLQERLQGKINVNFDTARRLFTLICVLHTGKAHIMR